MQRYTACWGLDIGHSSIKAAQVVRSGDTVVVQAYTIEPITVPENGDREEAVLKALEQLAQREEFGSTPVIAALSGRQVFSRTINVPVINPKTVDRMVELEARQHIPGNFEEVEWAFHMSPSAEGGSNDVALFAVKREVIQEMMAKCKKVGINLVGVSVSSVALYNFVRYDQVFPEDETVIILDVGAENTDLVFYQGDSVSMASLSVSGNDITKGFMRKFRVSFEEAEALKRQVGDSRQAEKIIKVIEGTLGDLTSEIQRRIGFHKSQAPNAKLDNLVISGSTFKLPGLPEYLAERLRYTVNILEDLDKVQVAPGLEREHFLHDLQSLGVAMGLALQGVGAAKADINLIPTQDRLHRILKSKRWAAVAAVVLLGSAFAVQYTKSEALLHENLELEQSIRKFDEDHKKDTQQAKAVLSKVVPTADELRVFQPMGHHLGLATAVLEGVSQAIAGVALRAGPIGDAATPADKGGDPLLQAVYLDTVTLDTLPAGTVFRPLSMPRRVTVKVRIPMVEGRAKWQEVRNQVLEALRSVPVPESLKAQFKDKGATLFDPGMVKLISEPESTSGFHYINETYIDPVSGDGREDKQARTIKERRAEFECLISPKEAAK